MFVASRDETTLRRYDDTIHLKDTMTLHRYDNRIHLKDMIYLKDLYHDGCVYVCTAARSSGPSPEKPSQTRDLCSEYLDILNLTFGPLMDVFLHMFAF